MPQELAVQSVKERVIHLMESKDVAQLAKLLEKLTSRQVVHLIGHLSHQDQMLLFNMISAEDAALIFEEIPEYQAIEILEDLEAVDAAAILNEMESDDQTDLIMELDAEDATAILNEMDPSEAASVRKLLTYEYDTAGGMMHTEYFSFLGTMRVGEVIEDLRLNSEEYKYYLLKYIFATNKSGQLTGVLQMQDLLLGQVNQTLAKINKEEVIFVNHLDSLDDLIAFFDKHELVGAPVVDDDHVLVGIILRRDILEAQSDRFTIEHLESQGIVGGEV